VLGGRDDASCLWLLTGKQYTHDIERDNSNIRHFLARFRRRTKVVSKQAYMVDLSLRLYHYLHDDLDNLKTYLQSFICIFG
jgi:insertion element IS1 protein InsB